LKLSRNLEEVMSKCGSGPVFETQTSRCYGNGATSSKSIFNVVPKAMNVVNW